MERPTELNLLSLNPFESLEHDNSLNYFAGKFLFEMGEIRFIWKSANKKELTFQGVRQPTTLHLQACHSSEPLDRDSGGA